jgi:hypothetical protein
MSIPAFVTQFKALHEKAKNGTLTAAERAEYKAGRSQFARFCLVAQELGRSGQTLRSNLRMAKLLKVDLQPDDGELMRLSTIDLASGGFAVLVPHLMRVGKGATFTLHLPGIRSAEGPAKGRCVVASGRPQGGSFRVSFRFDALSPSVQEQLDIAIIDAVLERFG